MILFPHALNTPSESTTLTSSEAGLNGTRTRYGCACWGGKAPCKPNFNTCWAVETVPLTEVPFMYACWDVEFPSQVPFMYACWDAQIANAVLRGTDCYSLDFIGG